MLSLTTIQQTDILSNSRTDIDDNFTALANAATTKYLVASSTAPSSTKAAADYVCTGINDDVQINAAIVAASSLNGGIVQLTAGTFYLGLPIVPAMNVHIQGSGLNITIIASSATNTGGNGDGFRFATSVLANYISNVTITDLTVDCSQSYASSPLGTDLSTYSNGMTLQGVNNLVIERVRVYKAFGFGIIVGVEGQVPVSSYVTNVTVRDYFVEGERNGNDGLGGGNVSNLVVENLHSLNCYGSGSDITNINGGFYHIVHVDRFDSSVNSPYGLGIGTDNGAVDVEYDSIYINGGLRGFAIGNYPATNVPNAANLTFNNIHVKNVNNEIIQFTNSINNPYQNVMVSKVYGSQWNMANNGSYAFQVSDITGFSMNDCKATTAAHSNLALHLTSAGGTNQGVTQAIIDKNDFTGCFVVISSLASTSKYKLIDNLGYNPIGSQTISLSSHVWINGTGSDVDVYVATAGSYTGTTVITPYGHSNATVPNAVVGMVYRVPAGAVLTFGFGGTVTTDPTLYGFGW